MHSDHYGIANAVVSVMLSKSLLKARCLHNCSVLIRLGTTIAIIQATDPDNDVITYSLGDAANGFFTINKNTGELMPATVLDREKHVRKL